MSGSESNSPSVPPPAPPPPSSAAAAAVNERNASPPPGVNCVGMSIYTSSMSELRKPPLCLGMIRLSQFRIVQKRVMKEGEVVCHIGSSHWSQEMRDEGKPPVLSFGVEVISTERESSNNNNENQNNNAADSSHRSIFGGKSTAVETQSLPVKLWLRDEYQAMMTAVTRFGGKFVSLDYHKNFLSRMGSMHEHISEGVADQLKYCADFVTGNAGKYHK